MQILQITDGTTTIDLLKPSDGYLLSSWLPQVAEYKDGGVWQDSKIAEGRKPVMGVYGNVVETMNIWLGASSQDDVASLVHNLETILENGFAYWQPGSIQSAPTYLVSKANSESSTRYALIYKGSIAGFSDPYYGAFESGIVHGGESKTSGQANLTLTLERGHWLSHIPGTGAQISTVSQVTSDVWVWENNYTLSGNLNSPYYCDIIRLASGRILVLSGAAIFGSDNEAASWNQYLTGSAVKHFLFQAANGDVYGGSLVPGNGYSLYKSTNDGQNFLPNTDIIPWAYAMCQSPTTGTLIVVGQDGAGGGIGRSTNNGSTWAKTYSEFVTTSVFFSVMCDAAGVFWALDLSNNIVKSTNDGVSWSVIAITRPAPTTFSYGITKLSDGYMYFICNAGSNPGVSYLYWSNDGGVTWEIKSTIGSDTNIELIELSDGTLMTIGFYSSFYRDVAIMTSGDFGYSWSRFVWGGTIPTYSIGILQIPDDSVLFANMENIVRGYESQVTVTGSGLSNKFANTGQTSFPFIEIDELSLGGGIPVLGRIVLSSAAETSNRVCVGARSVARGDDFKPYINISSANNFTGFGVTSNTNTSISSSFVTGVTVPDAPAVYAGKATSLIASMPMTTCFTVNISPLVTYQFYGAYRAFLRCRLKDAAYPMSVQLRISTGRGGVNFTTLSRTPTSTINMEVLDFGQVTLPASGDFKDTDIADYTQIELMVSATLAQSTLYLYDLILIPTDEWFGDFIDMANKSNSDIGNSNNILKKLDIDSLTDPRNRIKAILRRQDNDYVVSKYKVIGDAVTFRPNTTQRLWFFFMRTSATGTNSFVWLAPPTIQTGVDVYAAFRYKLLRGNQ